MSIGSTEILIAAAALSVLLGGAVLAIAFRAAKGGARVGVCPWCRVAVREDEPHCSRCQREMPPGWLDSPPGVK